ncbi:MAG: methylmalonyl Co-A mutase-associated GTPase MeaB [Chloroflexi bacterium]|nr:methylmalonyl Co-A mutase-associated GTPase MeaB [Chloroflexota bacterium]
MELVDEMLRGDVLSLARLITTVERDGADVPRIMKAIYPHLGKAYCVGITGPPGAGKSTVVDRLTAVIRQQGLTVGIIAADPTSPFTGGAVLGDRIRMQQHYLDEGVFIRSMATRGSHGGLPRTTGGVIKLLNAFGKDFILVETVGVGQTELDIMENVDTTVVVLVPEAGDTIQTMKAGLFEIADIFVVNKADRPGADNLVTELQMMVHLRCEESWWQVPVMATEAINNVGIEELCGQIEKHRQTLEETGRLTQRRQEQRRREFMETVERRVTDELFRLIKHDEELGQHMAMVEAGEIDPYSAADEVLRPGTLMASWSRQLAKRRPTS